MKNEKGRRVELGMGRERGRKRRKVDKRRRKGLEDGRMGSER